MMVKFHLVFLDVGSKIKLPAINELCPLKKWADVG